jgi:hypothetical protein
MPQIVLPHKYSAQLTGWTCGPASAKHVLSTAGRNDLTEAGLARECGTTTNGTDDINNIRPVLAKYTGRTWVRYGMPNDPPTRTQIDLLRSTIVATVVQERRGMVVNIVAPPSNNLPGYPSNQTIWHYIAVVGYDTDADLVYLADSARFGGHEHYWVSVQKLASLIPPKAWATLDVKAKPPAPPAPPVPAGALGEYAGKPKTVTGAGSNLDKPTYQVAVVHDPEGGFEGTISWIITGQEGSYHRMRARTGEGVQLVPEYRQAWAARATGNRIGLHACVEGYADWSRAQWLERAANGLEGLAHDLADWSKTYGIPLMRVSPSEVKAGKRGVCTHADISAAFGETDHSDPGAGFPLDLVLARARQLTPPTTDGGFTVAQIDDIMRKLDKIEKTQDWIVGQLGPGYDEWGEDGDLGRNSKGQRLTLRAGLAKLIRKVGA